MQHVRYATGAALLALGVLLVLGDALLLFWHLGSGGEHDIAARGLWILAMVVPQLAIASGLVTVGFALVITRRSAFSSWFRLALPILATVGAFALLYLDPGVSLLAVMRPLRVLLWGSGAAIIDAALITSGALLLRRGATSRASIHSRAV